jgi:hypothetical protein
MQGRAIRDKLWWRYFVSRVFTPKKRCHAEALEACGDGHYAHPSSASGAQARAFVFNLLFHSKCFTPIFKISQKMNK